MVKGSAPSYWEPLLSNANRVTYIWTNGAGNACTDVYSGMRIHDKSYEAYSYTDCSRWIDPHHTPLQIANRVDPATWKAVATDFQTASGCQPPPCRLCCLSFCMDVCAQKGYCEMAKRNVKAVVDKYAASLGEKGVKLGFFDQSGMFWAGQWNITGGNYGWTKHIVFGLTLELV